MSRIKQSNLPLLGFSLIALIMGILMYRYPLDVIDVLGYTIAAALLLLAIKFLYEFVKKEKTGKYYKYKIVVGVLFIAGAIAVVIKISIIQVFLIYLIGLLIIASAFIKGESAYFLRKMGNRWIPLLVIAILCLIMGIMVLQLPPNEAELGGFSQVGERGIATLGIVFATTGFIDFIYTLAVTPTIKEYKKEQKKS